MALSELDMMNLWAKQLTGYASQWERLFGFGYAVEAEVRKQDTALIQQMLDALENPSPHTDRSFAWKDGKWQNQRTAAITAARAWLEGKP